MSSPRLGVVRESMRTDPLLIQAPLGKTRSRGLTVPGPDFTFGTCNRVKDGGVAKGPPPRWPTCWPTSTASAGWTSNWTGTRTRTRTRTGTTEPRNQVLMGKPEPGEPTRDRLRPPPSPALPPGSAPRWPRLWTPSGSRARTGSDLCPPQGLNKPEPEQDRVRLLLSVRFRTGSNRSERAQ
ncbi:cilia- and flagella-associated protein 77 isoform 2-T2 [Menidia menidia]